MRNSRKRWRVLLGVFSKLNKIAYNFCLRICALKRTHNAVLIRTVIWFGLQRIAIAASMAPVEVKFVSGGMITLIEGKGDLIVLAGATQMTLLVACAWACKLFLKDMDQSFLEFLVVSYTREKIL